ncbi:MAG: cation diffusion facilitator family transporter [Acidimicrobiales bacterium]
MSAPGRQRRLAIALAINLAIVVAQVAFGLGARSLGLLADAGHNLADAVAVGLSLIAVRMTTRPATTERSFGWHRSTVLAAQANAAAILAVTALIGWEAIHRLAASHSAHVDAGVVLVVALTALVANAGAAAVVHERHSHDLIVRAALLHLGGDAIASGGVAVAATVMLVSGGAAWLDPVVSLAIGALISFEAIVLLRATADVLLESTPQGLDIDEMLDVIADVDGVEEVHDLHAWSLSSEVRALSAHIVMRGHPTLEEAQAVADNVKRAVSGPYGIAHATLELECESCVPPGIDPCSVGP